MERREVEPRAEWDTHVVIDAGESRSIGTSAERYLGAIRQDGRETGKELE